MSKATPAANTLRPHGSLGQSHRLRSGLWALVPTVPPPETQNIYDHLPDRWRSAIYVEKCQKTNSQQVREGQVAVSSETRAVSLRRQTLWDHFRLEGEASHECHFLTTTGSEKDAHNSVHKHHCPNFIPSDVGQQQCRENKRKVFLFWTCQAHDTQSRLKQARPWLPRSFWGPGGSQYPMSVIMGNEQKCRKEKQRAGVVSDIGVALKNSTEDRGWTNYKHSNAKWH